VSDSFTSKTKRNGGPEWTPDPDLWWYWNEADGDVGGLRAAPLEPSYGGKLDDGMERRVSAAGKYRDIALALGELPEEQVRLLEMAHRPLPPALRPRMGTLGALAYVVLDLAPSPEWALERLKPTGMEPEIAKLLEKAKRSARKALEAYQAERDRWLKATRRKR
jgi:hypothetical protein